MEPLRHGGYKIEDDVTSKGETKVVEIPITLGDKIMTLKEVKIRKQLENASLLQRHWADNQVSCTVTFDAEEEGPMIPELLDEFQHQLKGISFLPNLESGAYAQMPYEEITGDQYLEMKVNIRPVDFTNIGIKEDPKPENYCDNDKCDT